MNFLEVGKPLSNSTMQIFDRLPSGFAMVVRVSIAISQTRLSQQRLFLSADEVTKADRYRKEIDYRRSVIARAVLRQLLSQWLGVAAEEIQFEYGPFGKPLLGQCHKSQLQFNTSHSGQWILIGVSSSSPVGVDVEEMRSIETLEGLAKTAFSATEFAAWRQLPLEFAVAGFFRGWTCKEAVIKALGLGISLPLDNVEVDIDPRCPLTIQKLAVADEVASDWQVRIVPIADGYCGALACKSTVTDIQYIDWAWT